MIFPCQISGSIQANLLSQIFMTDFSVCVFDKNRCKEKSPLFVETSHGNVLWQRSLHEGL